MAENLFWNSENEDHRTKTFQHVQVFFKSEIKKQVAGMVISLGLHNKLRTPLRNWAGP